MRRIAVINQKGGVGKTTTTANLGAALALRKQRVVLVDLDPQAHLTLNFDAEPGEGEVSTYEVLTRAAPVGDALVEVRENLRLLPAHSDLVAAESELVSVVGREVILRDALAGLDGGYDYLFIDCPPSLGILTLNALAAADDVLIPLQPHFLGLQGLAKLFETVLLVRARINSGLRVCGVVVCMFEAGTRLATEVVDDLGRFLEAARGSDLPWSEARLFHSVIRRNIKLAESPGHGLTIFDYAPKSNGARDYWALADELAGPVEGAVDAAGPAEAIETPGGPQVPVCVGAGDGPSADNCAGAEERSTSQSADVRSTPTTPDMWAPADVGAANGPSACDDRVVTEGRPTETRDTPALAGSPVTTPTEHESITTIA